MSADINEMQLEIERKESRREGLLRNASKMHPKELYEIYNELSDALRGVRTNLPVAKRQLALLRNKLEAIKAKKEELKRAQEHVSSMTRQTDEAEREAVTCDVEFDRVNNTVNICCILTNNMHKNRSHVTLCAGQ